MSIRASEESFSEPFVLGLSGLPFGVCCKEEEHLGQLEKGWWDNFETFHVVLIGPFVKFYHLIYVHVTNVLPVVEYQGG